MARKIHLRTNKLTGANSPIALCASLAINGKIKTNKRETYRFMASEVVSFDDFKATASAERCAHCVQALPGFNTKRIAAGVREWVL